MIKEVEFNAGDRVAFIRRGAIEYGTLERIYDAIAYPVAIVSVDNGDEVETIKIDADMIAHPVESQDSGSDYYSRDEFREITSRAVAEYIADFGKHCEEKGDKIDPFLMLTISLIGAHIGAKLESAIYDEPDHD